jgi:hypothetical protein
MLVRLLGPISLLMMLGGVALVVAGSLCALGSTVILAGLLLTWAGLVKVVVVRLWHGVAAPQRALPFDDAERRRPTR